MNYFNTVFHIRIKPNCSKMSLKITQLHYNIYSVIAEETMLEIRDISKVVKEIEHKPGFFTYERA